MQPIHTFVLTCSNTGSDLERQGIVCDVKPHCIYHTQNATKSALFLMYISLCKIYEGIYVEKYALYTCYL